MDHPWRYEHATNHAKGPGSKVVTGRAELDVIPGIIEFGAEFGVQSLADLGVFDQAKVPIINAGLFETIARGISLDVPRQCCASHIAWATRKHKPVDIEWSGSVVKDKHFRSCRAPTC